MSGVCPKHGEYVQPGEECRWCEPATLTLRAWAATLTEPIMTGVVPESGPATCLHGYRCAMGCVQRRAVVLRPLGGKSFEANHKAAEAIADWAARIADPSLPAPVACPVGQHRPSSTRDACDRCGMGGPAIWAQLGSIPGEGM